MHYLLFYDAIEDLPRLTACDENPYPPGTWIHARIWRSSVALLTLERPEVFDALDLATARELVDRLLRISSDPDIRPRGRASAHR